MYPLTRSLMRLCVVATRGFQESNRDLPPIVDLNKHIAYAPSFGRPD